MRASIAIKILSIAFTVIAAMTAVSIVNLYATREVTSGIERITSGYLDVYGAIARINVYSTEEAYRTRRYIVEKTMGMHYEGGDLQASLDRLTQLDGLVHKDLDGARRVLAKELADPKSLVDLAALARIDERLSWIETEEKDHLDRQRQIMTALETGDMDRFRELFDDLTKWRAGYDSYMDLTRRAVFEAASTAGEQVSRHQNRATEFSIALLALACVLTVGTALILTRQLVRPLRELLIGVRAIASGSLEVEVPVKSSDEVGRLTEAFNQMTQELRVGVRARELFGKYVDSRVARNLIEVPHMLNQEGERRTMTVMFCDLQGFTRISEQMTPRGLVAVMNRYFTLMSEVIHDNSGVIDKFIGDAVMAYWGPPFVAEGEQASCAGAAAISQLESMGKLAAELPDLLNMKRGLPSLNLRIGIATGEVLVGSIGSDVMRSFTVMGDAVNLASRLESANKHYGTRILVAEDTARMIGEDIELREIDSLVVVGQTQPIRIYEILGRKGELPANDLIARDRYEDGLNAYRAQDWDQAQKAFDDVLRSMPEDSPSKLFLKRIEELRRTPPSSAWTGEWIMETK